MINKDFWKNKRVLITGHTGFKGSWLCLMLKKLDCDVYGYALDPPTQPSLFTEGGIQEIVTSCTADIRDYEKLSGFVRFCKPEIIIHMAAQPLVRESYKNPVETYQVNVIGTVNLLEAVRNSHGIKAVVNVTTDKCYENREWRWGYRENEPMGGSDPYSSSKGCSELVTAAYRESFFNPEDYSENRVAVATARAGNVIGGGDWAPDRLIPDFIRAVMNHEKLRIRNPHAIRPWQHVLEPLTGYMMLAERLYSEGIKYSGAWNFGPADSDSRDVEWIAEEICNSWGNGASYEIDKGKHPHEANYLKLDCSKAKSDLGWSPKWNIVQALGSIVEWNKARLAGENVRQVTEAQIDSYLNKEVS
jgi:CDP-glucose 4,6-dehydratase